MYIKDGRSVDKFLEDYTKVHAIFLNWRLFGDSGLMDVQDGNYSVISRFNHCDSQLHDLGKNIINLGMCRNAVIFNNPHILQYTRKPLRECKAVDPGISRFTSYGTIKNNIIDEKAELYHFRNKTWGEMMRRKYMTDDAFHESSKCDFRQNIVSIRKMFDEHNKNSVENNNLKLAMGMSIACDKPSMKVVVFGSTGMLGSEVVERFERTFDVIAPLRGEVDITNRKSLERYIKSLGHVDVIVNCTAKTDTTRIQNDLEYRNEAYLVNCIAVENLANVSNRNGIKFIHVSTDYVLSEHSSDGKNGNNREFPLNLYGYQKLLGEKASMVECEANKVLVARVGWLYGTRGNKSFVHKVIRNLVSSKKTGTDMKMVDDQFSTPTSVAFVANELVHCILHGISGIVSLSPYGTASRRDYALKIRDEVSKLEGMSGLGTVEISPCKTDQNAFPYPLKSELCKSDSWLFNNIEWKSDMEEYFSEHKDEFLSFCKQLEED